jgi:hypothetical protein
MLREIQKGVKKQVEALQSEQKKVNNSFDRKIDLLNIKITEDIIMMAEGNKNISEDIK